MDLSAYLVPVLSVVWGVFIIEPKEAPASIPLAPVDLARRIDGHLENYWKTHKVKPAAPASDAVFVRRVYLDLLGRIPTVAEVRSFLDDSTPSKRLRLVERLQETGAAAQHQARFWRREWLPQTETPQFATLNVEFDRWLTGRFQQGVPYDRIAFAVLSASRRANRTETPSTFLAANEFRAENLAANTMRGFLGINLDCAQCHDHPFARWTRNQFWETAAFFTRPVEKPATAGRLELQIPSTERTVPARALTLPDLVWPDNLNDESGRQVLAAWVTAAGNPYFARNAVNRLWANLLGTGLVEPLDDLSEENTPCHPALLDELTRAFVDSGYNLRTLTTAVMLSKAYQQASLGSEPGSPEPSLFTRAPVRALTGVQLFDSLRVAAALPPERDEFASVHANHERQVFVDRFRIERAGSAERSILQALALMNGKLTVALTDPAGTPILRSTAGAPFLDARSKIDLLYLATLSRKPTEAESLPLVRYLQKGGADGDSKKALADIFWALLNSSEFSTNH